MKKSILFLLLTIPAAALAETVEMVSQRDTRPMAVQQSTSTTVAAQITELSIPVPIGATVSFRVDLYATLSNPAAGIVVGMQSSERNQVYASSIGCQADGVGQTGASVTSADIASTVTLVSAGVSAHCVITGTITGSASAGSILTPTVARSSGVGTVTILANSTIKSERIR